MPVRFFPGHHCGRPIAERFWKKVDKRGPDECWLWTGTKTSAGYGTLNIKNISTKAHRLSYEIHNGPIPDGLHVLHKCDNPPCCNPKHLFLGTHQDNMDDRSAKGRQNAARGEQTYNVKLTENQVREIRNLRKNGVRQYEIAAIMGIARHHVYNVCRGTTWKHV